MMIVKIIFNTGNIYFNTSHTSQSSPVQRPCVWKILTTTTPLHSCIVAYFFFPSVSLKLVRQIGQVVLQNQYKLSWFICIDFITLFVLVQKGKSQLVSTQYLCEIHTFHCLKFGLRTPYEPCGSRAISDTL